MVCAISNTFSAGVFSQDMPRVSVPALGVTVRIFVIKIVLQFEIEILFF